MHGLLHSNMKLLSGKLNKTLKLSYHRRALLAHQYMGIYVKKKKAAKYF